MEERLLAFLEARGIDGFFVSKRENVRYISGYTGADSWLLVTKTRRTILTDPRYTEQAALECPEYQIYNWRKPGLTIADGVAALAQEQGLRSVAFEADAVNYTQYSGLKEKVRAELVPVTDVIEKMRAVKNEREIACLRAACEISCRAFERLLGEIRVGVTEKELAAKLSLYMVAEGADTQPYGNILISGPRTSLLHGIPSSKAIEYGDFVLMDFGCQYDGYLSDMTRTVVVGRASARQREVYELEQRMVEDSLAAMKAGTPVTEVYRASVRALEGTGYLEYHYPSIGHGVGMFVHELPFISPHSADMLEENNVTTIEPGIYIPGWGGVRIEDQVLITRDGYENLVRTPHDLIEL